jgi:hypothetical protein
VETEAESLVTLPARRLELSAYTGQLDPNYGSERELQALVARIQELECICRALDCRDAASGAVLRGAQKYCGALVTLSVTALILSLLAFAFSLVSLTQ